MGKRTETWEQRQSEAQSEDETLRGRTIAGVERSDWLGITAIVLDDGTRLVAESDDSSGPWIWPYRA